MKTLTTLFILLSFSVFGLAGTKLGLFSEVPGCGVRGGGCEEVVNGPWGKIPGLGWPVSFVGLAWFVSF